MGGNVFDMASSIQRERIKPTLENFYLESKKVFPQASNFIDSISPVGSVGKKPISGDLDLVMDGEMISPENLSKWNIEEKEVEVLVKQFEKRARTATIPQLYRRAVLTLIGNQVSERLATDLKKTAAGMLFFAYPQFDPTGEQTGDYVQIDLNVGKKDWMEFSYYSDEYTGDIKGLHRTQLLAALFSIKGYSFRHGFGVKNKETQELVADSPQQAIDLLNQEYGTQLTIDKVKNFYTLFKEIEDRVPEQEIRKVMKSYINRLKQAKAQTPPEIEKYLDQPLTENTGQSIGLFPGGFKPPHKGHFHIVKELAKKVDLVMILIGPKVRDGINSKHSREIWDIYRKYINVPVAIIESSVSPVQDVYTFVKENKEDYSEIYVTTSETDLERYKSFEKNKEKYGNINIFPIETVKTPDGEKVSGTDIRTSELGNTNWIPEEVKEKDKVLDILSNVVTEVRGYLAGKRSIEESLDKAFKIKERMNIGQEPISSKDRDKLVKLYDSLRKNKYLNLPDSKSIFLSEFVFEFQQDRIVIRTKGDRSLQERLTPYFGAIVEYMVNEGEKVTPLPQIVVTEDETQAFDILGKTAHYDPGLQQIKLYVLNRHPKDILRSFTHEMVHHIQNLEGRLENINTQNVNEDEYLEKIEEEAYLKGNILFRKWTDSINNAILEDENPCWDGYVMVGMKEKDGKQVPNCVPEN